VPCGSDVDRSAKIQQFSEKTWPVVLIVVLLDVYGRYKSWIEKRT
jgi:hypothetical protein